MIKLFKIMNICLMEIWFNITYPIKCFWKKHIQGMELKTRKIRGSPNYRLKWYKKKKKIN